MEDVKQTDVPRPSALPTASVRPNDATQRSSIEQNCSESSTQAGSAESQPTGTARPRRRGNTSKRAKKKGASQTTPRGSVPDTGNLKMKEGSDDSSTTDAAVVPLNETEAEPDSDPNANANVPNKDQSSLSPIQTKMSTNTEVVTSSNFDQTKSSSTIKTSTVTEMSFADNVNNSSGGEMTMKVSTTVEMCSTNNSRRKKAPPKLKVSTTSEASLDSRTQKVQNKKRSKD